MIIRRATEADAQSLWEMVALAADWRPAADVRHVAVVQADPALARYAAGWPKAGDDGFVAQAVGGSDMGAVWWRFFSSEQPGYGFVASDMPEVSIAVRPELRGRGVGRALMQRLIGHGREQGLPGLSLSVERENEAIRLYASLGYVEVGGSEGAATMLHRFAS